MKKAKLVQFSAEELKKFISEILIKEFESFKGMIDRKKKPNYLSKKNIVRIFDIDISIVDDWKKIVTLQNYQIYFKASDIESSMIKLVK